MGPLSYEIFRCLLPKPEQIARIDAPLFVTCDEPVLVDNDDHVQHLPECSLTREQLRRRKRATASGATYRQIIHVWPTRPAGVQVADAIAMPLTPSALLVLGRAGEQPVPEVFFHGDEARELAEDVNAALVAQAYEWVVAQPDHPSFRDWMFSLIGVCDGGSVMSQQLRSAPPHRWQRLRRDWPGIPRPE
jgi:hypothetical protein